MKTKIQTLLIVGSMMCAVSAAPAADVAENWGKLCASCHGKDGTGNTTMGKKAGTQDYTDAAVQAKFTDADAIKVIQEGKVEGDKKKMKSFKDKLTDDEVKALVAYIRAFKK